MGLTEILVQEIVNRDGIFLRELRQKEIIIQICLGG